MGKVLVLIILFVASVAIASPSGDRNTGRRLTCPPVETAELMGTPEAIYEMESGQLYAECGYFVKTGENSWESVLIVRAYWVEKEGTEQFDCRWEGKTDPFRYAISRTKQAYVDVFTYRPDFYRLTFAVQQDLFDQIVKLAIPCPRE